MKKILIVSFLLGSLAFGETIPIQDTLRELYAQYAEVSKEIDQCHRGLKHDKTDLSECEDYELILSDIKSRIEDIEKLKNTYYRKDR